MLSILLASVVVGAPIGEVRPADKEGNIGSPPRICVARLDKDEILVKEVVLIPVFKEISVKVKDGDAEKEVKQVVTEYIKEARERKISLKDVQAFGADGKKLDAKDLAERLKKDVAVLVSTDGREIDALYLRLIRADGVALVLPARKVDPVGAKPKLDPAKPLPLGVEIKP